MANFFETVDRWPPEATSPGRWKRGFESPAGPPYAKPASEAGSSKFKDALQKGHLGRSSATGVPTERAGDGAGSTPVTQ